MNSNAARALVAGGIVAAFGLGVWASPSLRSASSTPAEHTDVMLGAEGSAEPATASKSPAAMRSTLTATAEPVRMHAVPLLSRGTDTAKAAEGFTSAEQFLTIAHAARNTEVPFVLLKHRVLTEGKSVAAAIRASKPDLDAGLEADRARANARAELARLGSAAGL